MRVDVWSDIACPWCWVGKRHLEEAVRRQGLEREVQIDYHAYELRPKQGATELAKPFLERKFGSAERLAAAHARLSQMGLEAGISYDFEKARLANTFDAHRLAALARSHGRGAAAVERFMRAYHGEGADLASHDELRRLAADVGLGAAEVNEVLASDRFTDAVRSDEAQAVELGITGVPFFVFEGRYGVSGAQPVESFEQVLERVRTATPTTSSS